MKRMFEPDPATYAHLLDRLSRQMDLKYRDHSTALTFTLKATTPVSGEYEQDALFRAEQIVEAPQKEALFPPDLLA